MIGVLEVNSKRTSQAIGHALERKPPNGTVESRLVERDLGASDSCFWSGEEFESPGGDRVADVSRFGADQADDEGFSA